jgi:hypothetical protein
MELAGMSTHIRKGELWFAFSYSGDPDWTFFPARFPFKFNELAAKLNEKSAAQNDTGRFYSDASAIASANPWRKRKTPATQGVAGASIFWRSERDSNPRPPT